MSEDLTTKYRPKLLKHVLGQADVVKSLPGAIKAGKHAFLFEGESGTGKTTLARIVAAKVGCAPDNVVEVDAATNTGVDAMRQVTEGVQYASLGESPARLYVVDEAHALSKAAWQSLLKVVEEPPDHAYFAFCTTEGSKVPQTIRTRCVQYRLKPVPKDDVHALLKRVAEAEGFDTPDDVLYLIAEKCEGSPRLALSCLSQCYQCRTRKEAAGLIQAATEEGDVIQLCRALAAGVTSWPKLMKLLEPIKDQNGEGIRLTVVGYFAKVAMGARSDAAAEKALDILEAFQTPYPSGATVYPVILSLGRLL